MTESLNRLRTPDAGCRMAWWSGLLGLCLWVSTLPAAERPPVPPPPRSPVEFFRELLAMTPEQRQTALTNRPARAREIILSRITEYSALRPSDRELRLQAMHLRWLLLPLMRMDPAARAESLAGLSEGDRALVRERLERWGQLPAELQSRFLEHETSIDYFLRVQNSPLPPTPPGLTPAMDHQQRRLDVRLRRWQALDEEERGRMIGQFREFFELGPADLGRTMERISDSERRLMERALRRFATLDPEQRRACVLAFERLTRMSPEERTRFFHNVERWEAMSAPERAVWRELVRQVPQLPPMPPGFFLPPPPVSNAVVSVGG